MKFPVLSNQAWRAFGTYICKQLFLNMKVVKVNTEMNWVMKDKKALWYAPSQISPDINTVVTNAHSCHREVILSWTAQTVRGKGQTECT